MPAPLTVYRASAGAGKTFRLVVEYIKLLMLRPDNYKHILAVTFTKKATQEMKIRILSQLYGLKEGLHSSDSYMKCITEEMNIPEGEVRKTAAQSLAMILKDYNHFRIETIDSFFQSVLRNMARELDISSNMRVEINGEQVKDKAVDQLIDNLEPGDRLVECLQRFANENMEDGKTWNIISSLKEFGSSIFSDFYKSHSADYKSRMRENPNLFVGYKSKLYAIKGQAQKNILAAAESLRVLIEDTHGLDINMFKYSSNSGLGKLYEYLLKGEYMKIPATLYKYAAGENEWFNKKDAARYGTAVIANSLMPALQDYLRIHERMIHDMTSSNVLLSNLNSLELLADIEAAVDESNLKANRFMLSSTNQLLSEMIGESDSPFIYEKIGTRVEHLMIDEFQDTSTLQWRNFKKLLLESMSYYDAETARGSVGSMIVGDVKQSIYRWRDGDWNILNGIKGEFANDADTDVRTLGTNYRSEANIINFNNGFFNRAKQVVGIESAYSDVTQQVGRTGEACGEIEITMLTEEEYKARHLMIAQKVSDLMTKYGVKAKDIAILGRNNSILKDLSKTFMEHFPDIHVVSMESFMLNTSSAVCAIICALRLTQKPTDRILLATLAQYSGMSEVEVAKSVAGLNTRKPIFDVVEDILKDTGFKYYTIFRERKPEFIKL
ncbi:MAG: UvrD-helicase domain-containing protein [Bacteroidaceae bacterium]|nr:UvrD-helicase domain-containing protein [Bacteroidaceae bacterium]